MTESSDPSNGDEESTGASGDDAAGADDLEDAVQRGGTHSAPPMELDSIQGSRTGDDDQIVGLPRDER